MSKANAANAEGAGSAVAEEAPVATASGGAKAEPAITGAMKPAETRAWTAKPVPREFLLSDRRVADFICDGYTLVRPDLRPGLNEAIDAQLSAMTRNPGDGILDEAPLLWEVWDHPAVRGALASLLGHDARMSGHRHWHERKPSPHSQGWHQDGTNVRHHQARTVLGMYYPHDVTPEMGPTVIMPGTHFRNAPTDRMASYGNLRGQVALTVEAGTVAITHYDLWHGGSVNRSTRTRHMLKFLFNRGAEPVAGQAATPSWNHDAATGAQVAAERFGVWPPYCGQSDHYKQIQLRWACWNHMMGKGPAAPKGLGNPAD